jgi:hypothetical protein
MQSCERIDDARRCLRRVRAFHEAKMTEQDWLRCDDSIPMLECILASVGYPLDSRSGNPESLQELPSGWLSSKAAQRKLRLFACACVRRTRQFGGSDRLDAIRASEQYADGLVDQSALEAAFVPARKLPEPIPSDADMALSVFGPTDMVWEARLIDLLLCLGPKLDAPAAATKAAEIVSEREGAGYARRRGGSERSQQAHVLREIFGNPFRAVTLDPCSLNDSTRAIARGIYESGRFENLRPLAKALKKDVGCKHQEIRDHCQWPIRHVRGCWVIDLMLGY